MTFFLEATGPMGYESNEYRGDVKDLLAAIERHWNQGARSFFAEWQE